MVPLQLQSPTAVSARTGAPKIYSVVVDVSVLLVVESWSVVETLEGILGPVCANQFEAGIVATSQPIILDYTPVLAYQQS